MGILDWFKSFIPWHTSHKVNVDAKGVPREIQLKVSGLPDLNRIGFDVTEPTRSALLILTLATAFLFISLGIYVIIAAVWQLIAGLHIAAVGIVTTVATLLPWTLSLIYAIGEWNCAFLLYWFLHWNTNHLQKCGCTYTMIDDGNGRKVRYPLCLALVDFGLVPLISQFVVRGAVYLIRSLY